MDKEELKEIKEKIEKLEQKHRDLDRTIARLKGFQEALDCFPFYF